MKKSMRRCMKSLSKGKKNKNKNKNKKEDNIKKL